jgi:hypothetical protein
MPYLRIPIAAIFAACAMLLLSAIAAYSSCQLEKDVGGAKISAQPDRAWIYLVKTGGQSGATPADEQTLQVPLAAAGRISSVGGKYVMDAGAMQGIAPKGAVMLTIEGPNGVYKATGAYDYSPYEGKDVVWYGFPNLKDPLPRDKQRALQKHLASSKGDAPLKLSLLFDEKASLVYEVNLPAFAGLTKQAQELVREALAKEKNKQCEPFCLLC